PRVEDRQRLLDAAGDRQLDQPEPAERGAVAEAPERDRGAGVAVAELAEHAVQPPQLRRALERAEVRRPEAARRAPYDLADGRVGAHDVVADDRARLLVVEEAARPAPRLGIDVGVHAVAVVHELRAGRGDARIDVGGL